MPMAMTMTMATAAGAQSLLGDMAFEIGIQSGSGRWRSSRLEGRRGRRALLACFSIERSGRLLADHPAHQLMVGLRRQLPETPQRRIPPYWSG